MRFQLSGSLSKLQGGLLSKVDEDSKLQGGVLSKVDEDSPNASNKNISSEAH